MDLEHFEIIVNAMLSWSAEPRPPKKSTGPKPAVLAGPRDELDDDEDEDDAVIDDDEGDEDDEPEAALDAGADGDDEDEVDPDETGSALSEEVD